MISIKNLNKLSFLVYGLGLTGKSVVHFFKKNKIKNYQVWDDKNKSLFKIKRPNNISLAAKKVDFIILSPGINLNKSKNKNILGKHRDKIITDIDLIFLFKRDFKSIVVTGTNGKSTTCKIIEHLLKKKKFKTLLGGNIGTPILSLNVKKDNFLVIEASSFQLAYSKFISPDYALLLNITNDHLDWHGSMKNYIEAKFKIYKLQKKKKYSFLNKKFKKKFIKKNFLGNLVIPKYSHYQKIKHKIKNSYITSNINDENMSFIYALSKKLKIKNNLFIDSLKSFVGLPHRYEIFLKRENCIFINDSKATSFQATKFALKNTKNILWILGGLPKKNDKIVLTDLKKNIISAYIIGKSTNFFKNQIKGKINYFVAKNLKGALIKVFKDLKKFNEQKITILLSPSAASYDQFSNFENRGNKFKQLSNFYARKFH